MSYMPTEGANLGFAMPPAPNGQDLEPLNLGPNIFLAKPGDLPPEAFNSRTPTVQHLPDKIVKNTLPPQYKTENLPPKIEKTRVAPIFPPASQESVNLPNM
jgi:hypothetical protein